jgi:Pentapeptide repeats (8 copies)
VANQHHLDMLKQGIEVWNQWRAQYPEIRPDLIDANLRETDLSGADLRGVNLYGADLRGVNLCKANLCGSNLENTNLKEANLSGADLSRAILVRANMTYTILNDCVIYGVSAWDVDLVGAAQNNLVITAAGHPTITVDNLKVSQFIYLLVNNAEIRDVINTITSKVVLILGRFTPERKVVLDAIREELRKYDYLPVLFDFEKPTNRDLTETVSTLAHLARFIIVDLTDPSSAIHEVTSIIPLCIVPVQPLLLHDVANPRYEYAMFQDLRARYHWVLPTYQYRDISSLLSTLKEHVIEPAEQKAQELAKR